MECELCGRPISRLTQIMWEGAVYTVCEECSALGPDLKPSRGKFKKSKLDAGLEIPELVEGLGQVIRQEREKRGLTLDGLAAKIGEPASTIRRVEEDKLFPPARLVDKLERFFEIELHKGAKK